MRSLSRGSVSMGHEIDSLTDTEVSGGLAKRHPDIPASGVFVVFVWWWWSFAGGGVE